MKTTLYTNVLSGFSATNTNSYAMNSHGNKRSKPSKIKCYCDDDDDGHYHCFHCNKECASLTLRKQKNHDCIQIEDMFTDSDEDVIDVISTDEIEPTGERHDTASEKQIEPEANQQPIPELKEPIISLKFGCFEDYVLCDTKGNIILQTDKTDNISESINKMKVNSVVENDTKQVQKDALPVRGVSNRTKSYQVISGKVYHNSEIKREWVPKQSPTPVIPATNVRRVRKTKTPLVSTLVPNCVHSNIFDTLCEDNEVQPPSNNKNLSGDSYNRIPEQKTKSEGNVQLITRNPYMDVASVEQVTNALIEIAVQKDMTIQVIDKSNNIFKPVIFNNAKYYKVKTLHETGKIKQRDLKNSYLTELTLRKLADLSPNKIVHDDLIQQGTSGLILKPKFIVNSNVMYSNSEFMVIRGRFRRMILDSLSILPKKIYKRVTHYSSKSTAEQLFEGFEEAFVSTRDNAQHECERDISLKLCGEMCGTITQMLLPMFKITCLKCAKLIGGRNKHQITSDMCREKVIAYYYKLISTGHFQHVSNALSIVSPVEENSELIQSLFTTIDSISMNGQTSQFKQLNKIANIAVKGNAMNMSDLETLFEQLKELTLWYKNRIDSQKDGSLALFRNKVSAKTHINLALMCDNQLDINGFFQWGERGRHAKRLFSNYFELITDGSQYGKFSIRKHIRGERELAIRNLIVSENLEKMQQSFKGEPSKKFDLSEMCITKLENNYVFPCCCVTSDTGKPLLSEMYFPTKNHLIIGNTGDDKSVELPPSNNGHMYIAKDGYCYTLIFLAMLINIRESDAKDFTKRVRDNVIPHLGQWPTMQELAVRCRYLCAFYPEASTAEIPKILVDHENRTMHIMDSFGSKTTGYHILKANTVQQICKFGYIDLDSEMKHYNVGGRRKPVNINCYYGSEKFQQTIHITGREFDPHYEVCENEIWDNAYDDTFEIELQDPGLLSDFSIDDHEQGWRPRGVNYDSIFADAEVDEVLSDCTYVSSASEDVPRGTKRYKPPSIHTIDSTDHETSSAADSSYERDNTRTYDYSDEYCSDNEEHYVGCETDSQTNDISSTESEHYRNIENEILNTAPPRNGFEFFRQLIRASFSKKEFTKVLTDDPYLILFSILTPTVMKRMLDDGSYAIICQLFIQRSEDLAQMVTMLSLLAEQVSAHTVFSTQLRLIGDCSRRILELTPAFQPTNSSKHARDLLTIHSEYGLMDFELLSQGFVTNSLSLYETKKKCYDGIYHEEWHALNWQQKLCYECAYLKHRYSQRKSLKNTSITDIGYSVKSCFNQSLNSTSTYVKAWHASLFSTCKQIAHKVIDYMKRCYLSGLYYFIRDFMFYLNAIVFISAVLAGWNRIMNIRLRYKELQIFEAQIKDKEKHDKIEALFSDFKKEFGHNPTIEEFSDYLDQKDLILSAFFTKAYKTVQFQAKAKSELALEQIVAYFALFAMIFNAEKSDGVFKVLSKLKTVFSVTENTVAFQALDAPNDITEFLNTTINFELDQASSSDLHLNDITFEKYWTKQLNDNRMSLNYRCTGVLVEFTRANAVETVDVIRTNDKKEFLISGAVGSGKSTFLPHLLSQYGKVLILEPTRPLTENVFNGLQGCVFNQSASMFMRGSSVFGSGNISVMTTGYALHMLANNRQQIRTYDFIMLDECHVMDANAIAFYSLLQDVNYEGKILKTSATIPGREATFNFSTQYPITLSIETKLPFDRFVSEQGSGSNACVISRGNSILVYVASYAEVDALSKLLIEKGHRVTKVDGRTMKMGGTKIETHGTNEKKHFIVATNIIENGVTLDIDVVVDFGKKVTAVLNADSRMIQYIKTEISHGERIQRLGRVGRIKPGHALRIGDTEKGLPEVPNCIATEAAFLCFVYGLPIMPNNVVVSALGNCTVRQARTMSAFELSPFYMKDLVRNDGVMYPGIHATLKKYILRDTEIKLSDTALPFALTKAWLTAHEYNRIGGHILCDESTRIPFLVNGIPELIHEQIWTTIKDNAHKCRMQPINTASVQKIAYTLSTDSSVLVRTIGTIEEMIKEERHKQVQYQALKNSSVGANNFNLSYFVNLLKTRYLVDHSERNLEILQRARCQLIEVNTQYNPEMSNEVLREYPYLSAVNFQSKDDLVKFLDLKGKYNMKNIGTDIIVGIIAGVGCATMAFNAFYHEMTSDVIFQSRTRRRISFRDAADRKLNYAVAGDDSTIGHYFGTAYTKRGKKGGTVVGMGRKNHAFYNMYGFDPTEYSIVRFVDPITGNTFDEVASNATTRGIDELMRLRGEMVLDDVYDNQRFLSSDARVIEAYYMREGADKALKVDLTPHNPLMVCRNTESIAGFPDKEGVFRRTGPTIEIAKISVPKAKTYEPDTNVSYESKSICKGPRNYNAIAGSICHLHLSSDGRDRTTYGLGYGPYIIANQHLFTRNNGTLKIKSQHGTFNIQNTCQLALLPILGTDVIIIKLPKDHPPFNMKLNFRQPIPKEKVCMVNVEFNPSHTLALVSETSFTYNEKGTSFWKHWISTKEGQCGLPFVSTDDGNIVGLHSLSDNGSAVNYFTSLPELFEKQYLNTTEALNWTKGWKCNIDNISWGSLKIKEDAPEPCFKTSKLVSDIFNNVNFQSLEYTWLTKYLNDNLKQVGTCPGTLITKHIVKGKCPMFHLYLQNDQQAMNFFQPLMSQYGKSLLNKQAYIKDFTKYASVIEVGIVEPDIFEIAMNDVETILRDGGMKTCNYITDSSEIINSMNMKAAVGALYGGKKQTYFESLNDDQKEELFFTSCLRLVKGKMGVWNGSLKAEIRSQEKIAENKTRSFTAAPLETLLGGKACVDDFNNNFYLRNLEIPSTVGMTKFYRGWDKLLNALPDDWIYCDADGSRFDSSLTPYLLNAVLDIRLRFMEDWEYGEMMMRNLYTEIIYTPIATPDGSVIKKFKGNNSGQPSTVVDNTLMVMLSMQYSLRKTGIPLEQQSSVIKYFCNGDDLLIAIHPDKIKVLDELKSLFSELGLDYDFSSRTKNKDELYFMSHRGLRMNNMFIPKLDKERIVSILEWDRAAEPQHRLEAICASMIEAWGYDELLHEIRRFYQWLLEQAPYSLIAQEGKAPYIAETALKRLYTNEQATELELQAYYDLYNQLNNTEKAISYVTFQAGEEDAASQRPQKDKQINKPKDGDVDVGTTGTFTIPRVKMVSDKMRAPKYKGKIALNAAHLLEYKPDQIDLYNTRATRNQFENWYEAVQKEYKVTESEMEIILNGLMVWCIENGTSSNLTGIWTMMDGDTQVEYPLAPVVNNAKPTFRQIMAHYSDAAETYIEYRNATEKYMPRYGLQRNLTELSLARYAFDFYEMTSRTPRRAKEAHMQMKAAAVRGATNRLFGLDGNLGAEDENTERHTVTDVTRDQHSMLGLKM